jgi:hypothetical protein
VGGAELSGMLVTAVGVAVEFWATEPGWATAVARRVGSGCGTVGPQAASSHSPIVISRKKGVNPLVVNIKICVDSLLQLLTKQMLRAHKNRIAGNQYEQ